MNKIEDILTEFSRISGAGNVRGAMALIPDLVRILTDRISALDGSADETSPKQLLNETEGTADATEEKADDAAEKAKPSRGRPKKSA